MSRVKATICVLAAGALWGCISLFVRQLDAAGLSAMDITYVRVLVGAIGMLAVILFVDRSLLRIRLRDIWMFIGTGVISVTMFNVCYFMCMTMSEASIAVVLLYTSPIFVMLMSALFFKERVTGRKVLAIACTFRKRQKLRIGNEKALGALYGHSKSFLGSRRNPIGAF